MNTDQPLVTVNILSYNRKDELRNTLTKVYEQDYKNIEVIVVDNASNDGSSEMVIKEFPNAQLIQLEKNIGIAGWNEGFKVAIFEEHKKIGEPLKCAGLITSRVFDFLEFPHKIVVQNEVKGAHIHSPSGDLLTIGGRNL